MKKAVFAAAAAVVLSAAAAYATHAWGNYHWARTSNPFTLKLGDNVTAKWDKYLSTASNDWTKSSVLDTTIVAGGARNVKRCPTTDGRVEVCNAKYGYNGWLGVAGIKVSGGHITAGYVKLNDTYFDTAKYDTPEWRLFVMCQEVGHVFGLDHQDEDFDNPNLGTCMDYTSDPGTNQHPNQHDYDMLEEIYKHTDSTTTVKSTPIQVAARDLRDGELPPEVIASRARSFVVDHGDHEEVVFVTWAPDSHQPHRE